MENYELLNNGSRTFFYNIKARPIQLMLDFDYLSQRDKPSVSAIIHPGRRGFQRFFFGEKEILIPIYPNIEEASKKHPDTDSLINFASFRSAYESSKKALEQENIRCITIVAEGMPERETKELIALAKMKGKTIIGPATVGGIVAGQFRIGHAGGLNENIIRAKLYRPGSVGLVSRSGGMMNEFFNIIARTTDGIYEGIAIGGDHFPGSTLLEHMLRYEANPKIKMIVSLGEIGGTMEYEIIEAKKKGLLKKPIVMWISGTCAEIFPFEVQFGHAGAKAGSEQEGAKAKNEALKQAGIIIPESFERFEETIRKEFIKTIGSGMCIASPVRRFEEDNQTDFKGDAPSGDECWSSGYTSIRRTRCYEHTDKEEKNNNFGGVEAERKMPKEEAPKIPEIPENRISTHIISTISDDRGEEPTYAGQKISEIILSNKSIGEVIGLLWFKKELPKFFTEFLEKCIIIAADHGPAVSGAHNAIVSARAGKDIISSLCSGLLTIGPRFGGAIDGACRYFKEAKDRKNKDGSRGISPADFVEEMKQKQLLIPGIGHRIKSAKNPDKRVELLKNFAKQKFTSLKYLDFALEVEKETLKKAENLILNVDGCIAAMFLDALNCSGKFNEEEINQIVEIGYMNGLFALARSIGIIGHILDQKRLEEGLYRHPTEDILYWKS